MELRIDHSFNLTDVNVAVSVLNLPLGKSYTLNASAISKATGQKLASDTVLLPGELTLTAATSPAAEKTGDTYIITASVSANQSAANSANVDSIAAKTLEIQIFGCADCLNTDWNYTSAVSAGGSAGCRVALTGASLGMAAKEGYAIADTQPQNAQCLLDGYVNPIENWTYKNGLLEFKTDGAEVTGRTDVKLTLKCLIPVNSAISGEAQWLPVSVRTP